MLEDLKIGDKLRMIRSMSVGKKDEIVYVAALTEKGNLRIIEFTKSNGRSKDNTCVHTHGNNTFYYVGGESMHEFFKKIEETTLRKVTSLGENEGIHCSTEKEANAICKLMHDAGLTWSFGNSFLDKNYWNVNRNETIYYPKECYYGSVGFAKKRGYTIYPASDFLSGNTIAHKKSRPTYKRSATDDERVVFDEDAIGGRSIVSITESIQERKDSIARDETLLRRHRSLFSKKK